MEDKNVPENLLSFKNSLWFNKIGYKVYSIEQGYAVREFKMTSRQNSHTGMLLSRNDCDSSSDFLNNTIPAVPEDEALIYIARKIPGEIVFIRDNRNLIMCRFIVGDTIIEYESKARRTEEAVLDYMFSDETFRDIIEFYICGGKSYTLGR